MRVKALRESFDAEGNTSAARRRDAQEGAAPSRRHRTMSRDVPMHARNARHTPTSPPADSQRVTIMSRSYHAFNARATSFPSLPHPTHPSARCLNNAYHRAAAGRPPGTPFHPGLIGRREYGGGPKWRAFRCLAPPFAETCCRIVSVGGSSASVNSTRVCQRRARRRQRDTNGGITLCWL